jgi:hypothetical protein
MFFRNQEHCSRAKVIFRYEPVQHPEKKRFVLSFREYADQASEAYYLSSRLRRVSETKATATRPLLIGLATCSVPAVFSPSLHRLLPSYAKSNLADIHKTKTGRTSESESEVGRARQGDPSRFHLRRHHQAEEEDAGGQVRSAEMARPWRLMLPLLVLYSPIVYSQGDQSPTLCFQS